MADLYVPIMMDSIVATTVKLAGGTVYAFPLAQSGLVMKTTLSAEAAAIARHKSIKLERMLAAAQTGLGKLGETVSKHVNYATANASAAARAAACLVDGSTCSWAGCSCLSGNFCRPLSLIRVLVPLRVAAGRLHSTAGAVVAELVTLTHAWWTVLHASLLLSAGKPWHRGTWQA